LLKVLKYLKKSYIAVIFIIVLLCVQATEDLTLPDYTSKIVNVGIQQGGIENNTPEVLRNTTVDNLKLFLENENDILDNYTLISKTNLKTRALRLTKEPIGASEDVDSVSIPLVGNVAAGAPILAEQNIEEYFKISTSLLKKQSANNDTYMLKVKGDSMINVGIFNGDYVIISKCQTANNGEIVVAMIENEATVKTFYKEKDHIRLQPENDTMDPIIVHDVQILGKVIGLFRKF